MKNGQEIQEEMERLKKTILSTNLRSHLREQYVYMLKALEWVLEDEKDMVEERLKNVGITKASRTETEAE